MDRSLPKSSMLCVRRASNVCKLQLSASSPLASVFRKCISYSRRSLDVGDVLLPGGAPDEPPGAAPEVLEELPAG